MFLSFVEKQCVLQRAETVDQPITSALNLVARGRLQTTPITSSAKRNTATVRIWNIPHTEHAGMGQG
ncbi:hypothetical protein GR03_26100 [Escherichia coli]|nr:hypothetical protein GR03_26100 [Escherichia coli]